MHVFECVTNQATVSHLSQPVKSDPTKQSPATLHASTLTGEDFARGNRALCERMRQESKGRLSKPMPSPGQKRKRDCRQKETNQPRQRKNTNTRRVYQACMGVPSMHGCTKHAWRTFVVVDGEVYKARHRELVRAPLADRPRPAAENLTPPDPADREAEAAFVGLENRVERGVLGGHAQYAPVAPVNLYEYRKRETAREKPQEREREIKR